MRPRFAWASVNTPSACCLLTRASLTRLCHPPLFFSPQQLLEPAYRPRVDASQLPRSEAVNEQRRDSALERLRSAAAEAESSIARGPSRTALKRPASASPARSTPGGGAPGPGGAPAPAPSQASSATALDRLRAAMAEAEAKLVSNGAKQARSGTPSRSPAEVGTPIGAAGPPAPPTPALPRDMARALASLKGALETADGTLSDTRGSHWLGAHTPAWSAEPAWTVDKNANAALRAALKPMEARREPWEVTKQLGKASDAADANFGAALNAAVGGLGDPARFWGDVGTRLVRRYASPQVVRPSPWAHEPELAVPDGAAGHRGVSRKATLVDVPVDVPVRPRAASTGRISLAFSSPARNKWEVSLTLGAGIPMGDSSVGTTAKLVKTWERVPIPDCQADPVRQAGMQQGQCVDVALPRVREKLHDATWPRMVLPGKRADVASVTDAAQAREPWCEAVLRPRKEDALPAEADEAAPPAWNPKPQRGPHKVRRKAGKMALLTVALPAQSGGGVVPPQPPGRQQADVQQRAIHVQPPVAPETDVDMSMDEPPPAVTDDQPLPALEAPGQSPQADVCAPEPCGPTPQRVHACQPKAQGEVAFIPRDEVPIPRAGGKRWRARKRAEKQTVSTRTITKPRVRLTRWEAACIIQAHFRGYEARRMMSAIKARIMLSTHLVESRMAGAKGRSPGDSALPAAALRHVKVLAEAYEQSSHRPKFVRAEQQAHAASSAYKALAAMPDRRQANPLVKIYQTKGEAAAVEAAAKEALAWTNWMVPDLAKTSEDDATVAAVRAFKDMILREGEPVSEARSSADRISLKAAAEVVGSAMADLTAHGLSSDGYSSTTATIAHRMRDAKAAQGEVSGSRGRPAWEREAYAPPRRVRGTISSEEAAREAERDHFSRSYENIQREHKLPTPPATGAVPRKATPPASGAQAAARPQPAPAAAAPAPAAATATSGRTTSERPRWLDTAAALFARNGSSQQQQQVAAVVRLQSAVRRMRARRQLDILRARAELRAAVSAVRERGIAGQPAVLDKTMALGDAYLRAWNLPRAEQCYSHVLDTMERDFGQGDARCVRPASALAQVYKRRGEPARSLEVMQRATAPPVKPAAKDPFSSAFEGVGNMFGGLAPSTGMGPPSPSKPMATGSKVLDNAAAGVQDALANSSKAMQDQLGSLFGGGWLSSRPAAAVGGRQ